MRNRAFLKVVLLGLLTFALVPGIAGAAGQDLTGMLSSSAAERATAVSNAFIVVTPSAHDFGRVNSGTSSPAFPFDIKNTGNTNLTLTSFPQSNPGAGFATTYSGSLTLAPGAHGTLTAIFSPTGSGPKSSTVQIMSNADNGTFNVLLSGVANNPPSFSPAIDGNSYPLDAEVPFSLTATASDPEGDLLSWSTVGLPLGATFNSGTGELDWTPHVSDAGSYPVTITVSDGVASTDAHITLNVSATNSKPVANPGGPYEAGTTVPIVMDGSGSFDPDAGQTLTYAWNFGDGNTGTGVQPSHSYVAAGLYIVSLTVTDNGSPQLSSDPTTTTATIVSLIPAQILLKLPGNGVMKYGGKGSQEVGLEISTGGHAITDVALSSVRMRVVSPANAGSASSIAPIAKGSKLGDMDHDGIDDLDMFFTRTDLATLFSNLTGTTNVTIALDARTITGNLPISGTVAVAVKAAGNGVTAAAAPNPFKPFTNIAYSVRNSGPVSIRIFSVNGQLVRSLREDYATPGAYEVRWNGKDDLGRTAPSGIYFVSVKQGIESSTTRVVLAR